MTKYRKNLWLVIFQQETQINQKCENPNKLKTSKEEETYRICGFYISNQVWHMSVNIWQIVRLHFLQMQQMKLLHSSDSI